MWDDSFFTANCAAVVPIDAAGRVERVPLQFTFPGRILGILRPDRYHVLRAQLQRVDRVPI